MIEDQRDERIAAELDELAAGVPFLDDVMLSSITRRGSRRRSSRVVTTSVALLILAGPFIYLLTTLGDLAPQPAVQPTVSESPAPDPGVVTEDGVSITLPAGWSRASESLMPNLGDPRELMSVGTFDMPANHGSTCAQYPVTATERMGPGDAMVSILIRSGDAGPDNRPESFTLDRSTNDEWPQCMADPHMDFFHWFSPFNENGRMIYVAVAMGPEVPAQVRREAESVLDSIVVGPSTDGPALWPCCNSDKHLGIGMRLPIGDGFWINYPGDPRASSTQQVATLSSYQHLVPACPQVPEGEVAVMIDEILPPDGNGFSEHADPLPIREPSAATLAGGCDQSFVSREGFMKDGRAFEVTMVFGPGAFEHWAPILAATLGSFRTMMPQPDPEKVWTVSVLPHGQASSITSSPGAVWAHGYGVEGGGGPDRPAVLRLDPRDGRVVATIPTDVTTGWEVGGGGLTYGDGSIWIAGGAKIDGTYQGAVQRIDPETNRVTAPLALGGWGSGDVSVGPDAVWVAIGGKGKSNGSVVKIDPETNQVVGRVDMDVPYLRRIVATPDGIIVDEYSWDETGGPYGTWVAIDPETLSVTGRYSTGESPGALGGLFGWSDQAFGLLGDDIVAIDPVSAQPERLALTFEHSHQPRGFLVPVEEGYWFAAYPGANGVAPDVLSFMSPEGRIRGFGPAGGSTATILDGALYALDFDGRVTRTDLT